MPDLQVAAQWIRENTAEDAAILTQRAPQLAVLTGRPTFTYRYSRGRGLLNRYSVDYLVITAGREPRPLREEIEAVAVDRWTLPGETLEIEIYRIGR